MSAVFKERPIDPPEFEAQCWSDLSREEQRELLQMAMELQPRLVDRFYNDALSTGVDPFDYWSDIA